MRQFKLVLTVDVMFAGTLILTAPARASAYSYTTLYDPNDAYGSEG